MRQLTRCLAACGLAILLACEHRPPPASPFQPAGQPPPPLVLHEVALPPSVELDRLLDGLNAIGAHQAVWSLLEDFLQSVDGPTLAHNPAARQLVANAVVRVSHAPDFMEHFPDIRKAVDALLAVSPDAPETRFCRAYLRWILLADGQGGLRMGSLEPRVVADLANDFRHLTQTYPNWRGPGEFDPPRLRQELARVEALLATAVARAPTETNP